MGKTLQETLPYKARRLIFKISPRAAERLGFDFAFDAPNRTFLEHEIFGYLNRCYGSEDKHRKLLFIGIDKHNWHYHRLLQLQFHTIEIKPKNAVYGQPGHHVVGSATQLPDHYSPETFDVVIANGLIGFGLNSPDDFELLLAGSYHILKPGGVFVLGYNNTPHRLGFAIDNVKSFQYFEPFTPDIDDVKGPYHAIDDEFRHTYLFLRKPSE